MIPGFNKWYTLSVLTFAYLVNFIDRVILNILFTPIKNEFQFTDLQLSLLSSTSFILLYVTLGVYFGKLADKFSKIKLAGFGCAIWIIATGAISFANSFWWILFCRMIVGAGQAMFYPAALALIANLFSSKNRATAMSVYGSAIGLGTGISFLIGGWLNDVAGWRSVLIWLGFPFIIIAVAILFLKEDPNNLQKEKNVVPQTSILDLLKNKILIYHLIGYALFSAATNSIFVWMPSFIQRSSGLSTSFVGLLVGGGVIVAGSLSTITGGVFADYFHKKIPGSRMRFASIVSILTFLCWIFLLLAEKTFWQNLLLFPLIFTSLMWFGCATSDLNEIAGAENSGLVSGIYLFVVNLIGNGIAPPIYGFINDMLEVSKNPINMKFTLMLSPILLLGAGHFLWRGGIKFENFYKSKVI
ncbi:MAG: MFS transporter [Bacteroidetes bacterium]|nr:MFS transporter [Bacteroidota bacterium]